MPGGGLIGLEGVMRIKEEDGGSVVSRLREYLYAVGDWELVFSAVDSRMI